MIESRYIMNNFSEILLARFQLSIENLRWCISSSVTRLNASRDEEHEPSFEIEGGVLSRYVAATDLYSFVILVVTPIYSEKLQKSEGFTSSYFLRILRFGFT